MTYKEMMKISKDFYDTVDFEQFIDKCVYRINVRDLSAHRINVRDLMDILEKHYDDTDMLPEEFEGCFFNFIDEYEFTNYLRERYGWDIRREIIEEHYIVF